jgi:hypothetical protein
MTDLPQVRAQDPAAAGLPEEPDSGGRLNHEGTTSSMPGSRQGGRA